MLHNTHSITTTTLNVVTTFCDDEARHLHFNVMFMSHTARLYEPHKTAIIVHRYTVISFIKTNHITVTDLQHPYRYL